MEESQTALVKAELTKIHQIYIPDYKGSHNLISNGLNTTYRWDGNPGKTHEFNVTAPPYWQFYVRNEKGELFLFYSYKQESTDISK